MLHAFFFGSFCVFFDNSNMFLLLKNWFRTEKVDLLLELSGDLLDRQ